MAESVDSKILKIQAWLLGVIGSALIAVLGWIGISWDARLHRIEEVFIDDHAKTAALEVKVSHHEQVLAELSKP